MSGRKNRVETNCLGSFGHGAGGNAGVGLHRTLRSLTTYERLQAFVPPKTVRRQDKLSELISGVRELAFHRGDGRGFEARSEGIWRLAACLRSET